LSIPFLYSKHYGYILCEHILCIPLNQVKKNNSHNLLKSHIKCLSTDDILASSAGLIFLIWRIYKYTGNVWRPFTKTHRLTWSHVYVIIEAVIYNRYQIQCKLTTTIKGFLILKHLCFWIVASSKIFISTLSIHLLKFKLSAQQCLEKFLNYILDFLISFYFDHGLDCGYLENPNILGYMCWNISEHVISPGAKIKENFKVTILQIYKEYLASNR